MRPQYLSLPFIVSVFAAPVKEKRASCPSVTVNNGTIVGETLLGIDSFHGIPYAQPPTGTLRLKPPQSYDTEYPSGTLVATGIPTACPQFRISTDSHKLLSDALGHFADSPFFQTITKQGEDCLTLNVQRPSGTTEDSKLPVVFWIFGGGMLKPVISVEVWLTHYPRFRVRLDPTLQR